jgi:adenine-specific DNA-methyltransferase
MDGKSLNTKEDLISRLKEIAPQVFNEDKIDWEKLKSTFGDDINFADERYVLNWAGKSDAFRAIQTQTTATLIPDKEESVNFDKTDNIFIEGENLEVLKVLQKAYYGKIKMIYIDPPYNTGNDFIYNDKFAENKNEYLLRSGEKDEEGFLTNENLYRKNSKESGHYHSNWLTMMYPRLFLARNLLCDDGVIFVSIDDNEMHNLRMVMNEIFGEENFVECIVWLNKEGGGGSDSKYFRKKHEYLLVFARNVESLIISGVDITNKERYKLSDKYVETRGKFYLQKLAQSSIQYSDSLNYAIIAPDKTKVYPGFTNGKKNCYRWSRKKVKWGVLNGFIVFNKDKENQWQVYTKQYLNCDNEGNIIERKNRPVAVIDEYSTTQSSKYLKALFKGEIFKYSKPYELINYLIKLSIQSNDTILDFFAGSATTAHAVLDLNKEDSGRRKFIMVQLPEKTDEKSEAYKAGYETIADIGKERIRRVIKKIEDEQKEKLNFEENKPDLGFKVFKLQESNFKIWRGDKFKTGEELEEQLRTFVNPMKERSTEENMLYELLLKSGIDLNCRIEKRDSFYLINENELVIALSKINKEIVKAIIKTKPLKVITLDKLFEGNDQLKTNTILQMKDAGIEFKVV